MLCFLCFHEWPNNSKQQQSQWQISKSQNKQQELWHHLHNNLWCHLDCCMANSELLSFSSQHWSKWLLTTWFFPELHYPERDMQFHQMSNHIPTTSLYIENERMLYMNSMQTCNSVTFYFMRNSFSDASRKWILPNMIRVEFMAVVFCIIEMMLSVWMKILQEL